MSLDAFPVAVAAGAFDEGAPAVARVSPDRTSGAQAGEIRRAEDAALLARAADGDEASWRALVDLYLDDLVGFGWYLTGDRAEAEDVAQETFLKLIDKARTWDAAGLAGLRTWLHRVARNLAIDRMRRTRAMGLDDLAPAQIPSIGHAGERPQFDRAHHVRRALDSLPDRQREALVLTHYQGFSQIEAAELMDASIEAVESLLSRARRALKDALAPVRDDLI